MADLTPAATLRAAATRLRCDHLHPVQPPEGSLAKPGDCRMCGAPFNPEFVDGIERLAEPLAAWLEREARNEEYSLAEFGHRTIQGDTLALARSILGRTS